MSSEPSPYTPPPPFDPSAGASPAKPRRSLGWILTVVGVVLLAPCVCCTGIGIFVGRGVYLAVTERENVQVVVDKYMQNMRDKNADAAFELFSARARRQMQLDQVRLMLEGPGYAMFGGYDKSTIALINVSSSINSNQDVPQGTVASVNGTVAYDDGSQGTFQAVLEREGEQWRLHSINVTVPPGKLNAGVK